MADAVAAAWFEERAHLTPVDAVGRLARHHTLPTEDRSPAVAEYLAARPPLPDWVDPALVRAGQRFFEQWGPQIGVALFVASLPSGYAGAKGAKVLYRTARLVTDPRRRVMETGQMLLHTMCEGGLDVGGAGWHDARRVRLMHAAVRHLVLTDPKEPWDVAELGVPANQEDLLGTLWTFSLTTLDVLRRSGVRFTRHEAEAYLHAWEVVGHLVGVGDDLVPLGLDDAEACFAAIRRRQYAASEEGGVLTSALIGLLRDMLPGRVLDGLPATAIRHYVGNEVADILGVPRAGWTHRLFAAGRILDEAEDAADDHAHAMRRVSEWMGKLLWRGFLAVEDRGHRAPFEMPDHLADGWGIRGLARREEVIDLRDAAASGAATSTSGRRRAGS